MFESILKKITNKCLFCFCLSFWYFWKDVFHEIMGFFFKILLNETLIYIFYYNFIYTFKFYLLFTFSLFLLCFLNTFIFLYTLHLYGRSFPHMLGFEGVCLYTLVCVRCSHDGVCGLHSWKRWMFTQWSIWLHVGVCKVTEEISTKFLHPDQEAVVALPVACLWLLGTDIWGTWKGDL